MAEGNAKENSSNKIFFGALFENNRTADYAFCFSVVLYNV